MSVLGFPVRSALGFPMRSALGFRGVRGVLTCHPYNKIQVTLSGVDSGLCTSQCFAAGDSFFDPPPPGPPYWLKTYKILASYIDGVFVMDVLFSHLEDTPPLCVYVFDYPNGTVIDHQWYLGDEYGNPIYPAQCNSQVVAADDPDFGFEIRVSVNASTNKVTRVISRKQQSGVWANVTFFDSGVGAWDFGYPISNAILSCASTNESDQTASTTGTATVEILP